VGPASRQQYSTMYGMSKLRLFMLSSGYAMSIYSVCDVTLWRFTTTMHFVTLLGCKYLYDLCLESKGTLQDLSEQRSWKLQ
jgi:hypothetical protein